MDAGTPGAEIDQVEREIIARIKAAKIRLRFDRVVRALVNGLTTALAGFIPDDEAVLFTLTAPIKLPDKTEAVLASRMRAGLTESDHRETILGNEIRIRKVIGIPGSMPRLIGFVHNPDADAAFILDLAERRLLGRD